VRVIHEASAWGRNGQRSGVRMLDSHWVGAMIQGCRR
jgi:hypothetical protein